MTVMLRVRLVVASCRGAAFVQWDTSVVLLHPDMIGT